MSTLTSASLHVTVTKQKARKLTCVTTTSYNQATVCLLQRVESIQDTYIRLKDDVATVPDIRLISFADPNKQSWSAHVQKTSYNLFTHRFDDGTTLIPP